jgi:hypothetical protein
MPKKTSTIWFGCIFGVLLVANLVQLTTLNFRRKKVARLTTQQTMALAELERANTSYKIGKMGQSARNELNGWRRAPAHPLAMLNVLSTMTEALKLQTLRIERPALYRPLSDEQKTEFFKFSLAFAGHASMEISEQVAGQGESGLYYFCKEINRTTGSTFISEKGAPEEGAPQSTMPHWNLNAPLDPISAWAEVDDEN